MVITIRSNSKTTILSLRAALVAKKGVGTPWLVLVFFVVIGGYIVPGFELPLDLRGYIVPGFELSKAAFA